MSTSPVMTPRPMEPLDESTFRSVLVVVAHPDDIEYGMAAAVDRWVKAGKTVSYLLASRGEAGIDTMNPSEAGPVREAEERAGAKVVGVDVVDFLDFHDGVIEYGVPLRRELCRVMRMRQPDCVVSRRSMPSETAGTGGSSLTSPTRASSPGPASRRSSSAPPPWRRTMSTSPTTSSRPSRPWRPTTRTTTPCPRTFPRPATS